MFVLSSQCRRQQSRLVSFQGEIQATSVIRAGLQSASDDLVKLKRFADLDEEITKARVSPAMKAHLPRSR
jgi:hypothetical protein